MQRSRFISARCGAWTLFAAGAALALAGLLRAARLAAATPDTWAAPELWLDGILLAGAVVAAAAGALLHGRALAAARATPATFLTLDEEAAVLGAIRAFERRTSGEIRVHLRRRARAPILDEARATFERLGMAATRERNGVLFFVAVAQREFAVVGDRGIDERTPPDFWSAIAAGVEQELRAGRYAQGLIWGVNQAGEALAGLFPRRADDQNELPDDLSRS